MTFKSIQNELVDYKEHTIRLVDTWNPSYSGGRNQEGHSLRPAQTKRFVKPHVNQ
jgi:hypothetical protein